MTRNNINPVLGISSFVYRYHIGSGNFIPQKPMNAIDFLEEAKRLGYTTVQLCENLNYSHLGDDQLKVISKRAKELELSAEIGMKDLTLENLNRHFEIAEIFSSKFIRIVLGKNGVHPEEDPDELMQTAIRVLNKALPYCREKDITLGIENHFDLPTASLVKIADTINDPHVGLIYDSTNGIGFVEHPELTLSTVARHLVSMHLKDYRMSKVEAGYMMTGAILGEGWLDLDNVLLKAFRRKPDLTILLEMTIRRDEKQSMNEVLEWEKTAIEKSTKKLFDVVNSLKINHDEVLI